MNSKEELRAFMLQKRNSLTKAEVQSSSDIIMKHLFQSKEYQASTEVFTYVSYGCEVDTHKLITDCYDLGKRIFVPKVIGNGLMEFYQIHGLTELAPGTLGILEPKEGKAMKVQDLCAPLLILPGLAFDPSGNRLGFGGGYYDRYLSRLPKDAIKIALCYEFQVIPEVMTQPYDKTVDIIITEKNIYKKR